jgi:DNA repair protein RadC
MANIKKQLSMLSQKAGRRSKNMTCSRDIFCEYETELATMDREVFIVAGLTAKNEIIAETVISVGASDSCLVNPREVFRALVSAPRVTRAIVLHNHPSGDCTPSPDDVALTKRLVQCGEILGIPLLDHIITGAIGSYVSLRDLGLI